MYAIRRITQRDRKATAVPTGGPYGLRLPCGENHRKDARDVERQYADAYVGLPTDGECVGMAVESCCVDFFFEKLQALFFGDGDAVQL